MPIICATDFSPSARAAVGVAVAMARRLDQPIILFHAVQVPYGASAATDTGAVLSSLTVMVHEVAAEQLETAANQLRELGLTVTTELSTGAPATEIIRLAEEKHADAVVLGTHGRAGVVRFFLGSVAERVAREVETPVFVVHAERGSPGESLQTQRAIRLAVILDGGSADRAALEWAAKLSDRTACEVVLARLVAPEIEAARYGVDEIWDGVHASGPLIDAVNRTLTRELQPFPQLATASRRFVLATEETAGRAARDLAALEPTLAVVGMSADRSARRGRAVQPNTLMRTLTIPVVCVHHRQAQDEEVIPSIYSVLVAVDLARPAPAALMRAYSLLRNTGGRVELCYVHQPGWDAFGDVVLKGPLSASERAACERDLRALVPPEAAALGIETNVSVLEGSDPAVAIRQAAARLGVDVIAVATQDRTGLDRALRGSTSDAVVHTTETPTLVVHA
jgi:nucleotide-binding universal stress UspA family protein